MLFAAEDEFQELCFDFGLELDEVVSFFKSMIIIVMVMWYVVLLSLIFWNYKKHSYLKYLN